ncbi:hypothetical protein ACINWC743_4060 [Acinetobacter sp. WC-743]|nr:hypothetical protein ACINWC743_4060 [Acinetobacter sp. WC-743]
MWVSLLSDQILTLHRNQCIQINCTMPHFLTHVPKLIYLAGSTTISYRFKLSIVLNYSQN